jgi:hypothetical protein
VRSYHVFLAAIALESAWRKEEVPEEEEEEEEEEEKEEEHVCTFCLELLCACLLVSPSVKNLG